MDICLVTLNSTYQHTAFGLRYLYANLGELQSRCEILEYVIQKNPQEIAEQVLKRNPQIVGFGVYIWNTDQTKAVIEILKKQAPELRIVLGGPEVSFESEAQPICQISDYVIKGEADFLFREFCESVLLKGIPPIEKFISGPLPDISKIRSPYAFFTENDIRNRITYVEASRGCPFKCEYCLSSLDKSVRNFQIDLFLQDLQSLIQRGARQFKFIDRTFNLSPTISGRILQFFLDRIDLGLFLHFEMVPDRLPMELRDLIIQFPEGSLQFEIGIQTLNPQVAALVSRKNDLAKVKENLFFLHSKTKVHTHVDLIAGLPGEDLVSFAAGFDQLLSYAPDEIQLGILKRLKGTPIIRHDVPWQMKYKLEPPFQIMSTKNMESDTLVKMQMMSRFWDMIANSGNFTSTWTTMKSILFSKGLSPFYWFWSFSDFLTEYFQRSHSIPLIALFEATLDYLKQDSHLNEIQILELLGNDYRKGGLRTLPRFLFSQETEFKKFSSSEIKTAPKRQRRHLQVSV